MADARQIQPVPRIQRGAQAPTTGQAEVYGSLASRLQEHGKVLEQRLAARTQMRASEAGTLAGAEPGFERTGGISVADQAYDTAGLKAQEAFLSNQIRGRVDQLAEEHKENPGEFAAALGIDENGLTGKGYASEMVAKADPLLQKPLEQAVLLRGSYRLRQLGAAAQARLDDANKAAFEADLAGWARDGEQAAFDGDRDAMLQTMAAFTARLDEATGQIDAEGNPTTTAYLSDVEAGRMARAFDAAMIAGEWEGRIARAPGIEGKTALRSKIIEDERMDLGERAKVLSSLDKQIRALETEYKAMVSVNDKSARRAIEAMNLGVTGAQSLLVDKIAAGQVPVSPDVHQEVVDAVESYAATSALSRAPLPVVEDQARQAANLRATGAYPDVTTARMGAAIEKLAPAMRTAYERDPRAYAETHGVPEAPALDFSSQDNLAASLVATREAYEASMAQFADPQMPVLRADQADTLARVLTEAPAGDTANVLANVVEIMGDDARKVFGQVAGKGAGLAAVAGVLTAEGRGGVAQEVLAGRDKIALPGAKEALPKGQPYQDALNEARLAELYPPGLEKVAKAVVDATNALYLQRLGNDLSAFSDPEPWVDAFRAVAGEPMVIAGRTYFAPPGATQDDFLAWANRIDDEQAAAYGVSADELKDAIGGTGGQLISTGTGGEYMVQVGGFVLTDAQGNPAVLKYARY